MHRGSRGTDTPLRCFFQNIELPPNLPNRAVWLAEFGMQDDVPAYAPGHNSSCLQVSLPCHALSGMTETCKTASWGPSRPY